MFSAVVKFNQQSFVPVNDMSSVQQKKNKNKNKKKNKNKNKKKNKKKKDMLLY